MWAILFLITAVLINLVSIFYYLDQEGKKHLLVLHSISAGALAVTLLTMLPK